MLEMGIIVGLGLLVMLVKLPWRWKMRLLSNPVVVDFIIFGLLTCLHWGTFSGVMVATIGAFFCSIVLSIGKWLFGSVRAGKYFPGKFDVRSKLVS
jgi:hypothetical protein